MLVSAEELLVLLNLSTKIIFIAKMLNLFLSNLLATSTEVGSTTHGPLQRQCFQDYSDSTMDTFSTSKKDQAFFAWESSSYAIWCMPYIC